MMGLGIAFLVALALFATAGGASAKAPSGPPPDLPPVVPGPPDPAKPTATTAGKSGTQWITQAVGQSGATLYVDVFLPDGQLGAHPTFRVLRYSQTGSSRSFMQAAPGVDPRVLALAMSDFNLTASTVSDGIDVSQMSADLQQRLADVLHALTVGPDGKIVGPVTADAIQLATALAGELDRAGFGAAATALRAYIQAAGAYVPPPPPHKQVPLPDTMPADLQALVNRALQLERDPAKLTAIVNALKAYQPQTPDIANAIGMLQALIVQVTGQQSAQETIQKIQTTIDTPHDVGPGGVRVPPPPPPPPGGNTYIVTSADKRGPWGLAEDFTGNGNRWTELKPLNPHHDLSKQWWAGMHVNLPASWPAQKRSAGGGAMPEQTIAPSGGANIYTVTAADKKGPWGLAQDFTGNGARWTELKPLNTHYNLEKQWWAGMSLNLPASWPAQKRSAAPAPAMATTLPEAPIAIPSVPTPQPAAVPKSPIEIAADAVVRNIKAVQANYGMPGAHGKEDKGLVSRFQGFTGGGVDGMAGPGTFVALAQNGQSDLPLVMYWSRHSTANDVITYRNTLLNLAAQAQAAGDITSAANLQASAAREHGEGGISSGQLVP